MLLQSSETTKVKSTQKEGIELNSTVRGIGVKPDQLALKVAYSRVGLEAPEADGYTLPGLEEHRSTVKKIVNSMLFPRHPNWTNIVPASLTKKLPDHVGGDQIAEAIQRLHAPLLPVWWTDIGHRIQRIESDIIVACLLECVEKDITALQVHDALIVPRSQLEVIEEIMLRHFKALTGFSGGVSLD